ncbi:hypothetical protein N7504_007728 [Penicillium tannophilum]|nr:hypothetical protein N7504_007728 [Penicillium tannophilum]
MSQSGNPRVLLLGLRVSVVGPPLLSEISSNCNRLLRLEHSDRPPTPTKTRNHADLAPLEVHVAIHELK